MHFDLIDLRLYLNVVQAGNITAGASLSHLSLAAASARIRAMEAAFGVECLQRSRRGVSPTPAGQALTQHARLLLQQVERVHHDMAEYAQGFKGQVRLLCNTAALTEYLPELLADFVHQHPAISVDLQELTSLRITHALRQNAADIGVVSSAVDTHDLYTRALGLFAEAMAGRGRPSADGIDGVKSLAVALAVREAARTGRAVRVGYEGF